VLHSRRCSSALFGSILDLAGGEMKRKVADAKVPKVVWTQDEDTELMAAVLAAQKVKDEDDEDGNNSDDEEDWDAIAELLSGKKTAVQCYKRYSVLKSTEESGGEPATNDEDGASKTDGSKTKKTKPNSEDSGWKAEEVELLKKLTEDYTKRNGMFDGIVPHC